MDAENDILNELTAISPLIAGFPKTNVFTVPDNYFTSVSDTVLVCIREEKLNAVIPDAIPVMNDVPANYFNNLPSIILAKIKASDKAAAADDIIPLLQFDAKSTNVFDVPPGYFETLPAAIMARINESGKVKVVSISTYKRVLKYAVAAILMSAVALGTYRYFDNPVKNVQSSDIKITLDPAIEAGKQMNETVFNETLNGLSESAISAYLENNSEDSDIAMLTSALVEGNLPEQDDYLINENTLQNYLDKIDKLNN